MFPLTINEIPQLPELPDFPEVGTMQHSTSALLGFKHPSKFCHFEQIHHTGLM